MPYHWIRFLHIFSAIGFAAIHGASIVVLYAIRKETDRTKIESLLGFSAGCRQPTVLPFTVSSIAASAAFWMIYPLVLALVVIIGGFVTGKIGPTRPDTAAA